MKFWLVGDCLVLYISVVAYRGGDEKRARPPRREPGNTAAKNDVGQASGSGPRRRDFKKCFSGHSAGRWFGDREMR